MTDRAALEALLARVLQGTGPDRELDAEIVAAFTPGVVGLGDEIPDENWCNRLYQWDPPRVWADSWLPVPKYTESLDAALTLVPTKPVPNLRSGTWWWLLEVWPDEVNASVHYENGDSAIIEERASAATPPRALIAACLKARMEAQGE